MANSVLGQLLIAFVIIFPSVGYAADDRQRIISWYNIGYSSKVAADRTVGRNIKTDGWKGFVRREILRQLHAGVRRIQLHNPFGALPNERMQFDQYLYALSSGLYWLYADFVDAWTPVIRGAYTDGEPVEVIAYLGSLDDGKSFKRLLDRGDVQGFLSRALASIEPVQRAGMSIGFDSLGGKDGVAEEHAAYQFLFRLKAQGVRTYVEPRPHRDHVHLHDSDIIILNKYWRLTERHPAAKHWVAPKEQLTGEIVRIVRKPYKNKTLIETARHVLQDGHTCAFAFYRLPFGTTVEYVLDAPPDRRGESGGK